MKTKAAFLLVIFLLNTVLGFGCALGMQQNHGDENHSHTRSVVHEHHITTIPGLGFSKEDPCCKKIVNELTIKSKLIPESAKIPTVLPVVWLADYAYTLLNPVNSIEPSQRAYVDHRYRPPNEDVRIIIQSFQI